ncbi:FkbM family methyltransferase [Janibacter sp. DB-40]|uniref:FkbM family methyltransferase n=1 Tax=Janibacter sp. DB-40 TaxID=3028808 RepID=UPI002405E4CB|nr:FkbM family methyltransferase [Janibacter sp. DB-40]
MTNAGLENVDLEWEGQRLSLTGHPGEYIFEQVRASGTFYEGDLLQALAGVALTGSGWIVDGGANIGNHSLFFATALDRQVLAIEPDPENHSILQENVARNHLQERVSIRDVALWDSVTTLRLANEHPDNSGQVHVVESGGTEVEASTLDSLCEGIDVALLKLDIEGSEVRALNGARSLLTRSHPILCIEAHGPTSVRKLEAVLAPLGYEVLLIGGRSDNFVYVHPDSPTVSSADQLRHRLAVERDRRRERQHSSTDQRLTRSLAEITTHVAEGQLAATRPELGDLREQLAAAHSAATTVREMHDQRTRALDDLLEENRRSHGELNAALTEHRLRLQEKVREVEELRATVSSLQEDLAQSRDDRGALEEQFRAATDQHARSAADLSTVEDHLRQSLDREAKHRRDLDLLGMSYQLVSSRLESISPGSWDHAVGVDTAFGLLSGDQPPTILHREAPSSDIRPLLNHHVRKDHVRIGIATMPGREDGLAMVLRSLAPQADDIHVYLNQMDSVPSSLPAYDNVHFHTGPDHGDRGKFLFIDGYEGYYLTCDDDIAYPDFYVDHLLDGIERFDRKAIVGWHGSIFLDGFTDYYDAKSRRVLAYYSTREADTGVHLLGTGAAGFHTHTIPVASDDFKIPNMADVWLALKAQEFRTPMVVLAHERGWADPIDRHAPSISNASIKKDGGKRLDVRETVTKTVADHHPWIINETAPTWSRDRFDIAIVGRTDRDRWRKGGILKSTHLMADALRRFGVNCVLADIETGDPFTLEGADPEIVIIYAGDPDRPDYARAREIAEKHMSEGRVVVINMSLQAVPARTASIVHSMQELDRAHPGKVRLMTFSLGAKHMPGMEPIRDLILEIPKTLAPVSPPYAEFGSTAGVFVGDIAKLSDPALVGGPGRDWVAAIREALPGVPIYGVQQYRPRFEPDFELDEVWPFLKDDFSERLSKVRLMVAPTKFATFEMVPMEVAGLGVPVIYRDMPQSLSETLGLAGVEVDSPAGLSRLLPSLYHDPILWRTFSHAGRARAESQEVHHASGQIYLQLASLRHETGRLP